MNSGLAKASLKRLAGAGALAAMLAVPLTGHAMTSLLPTFKECLAAAERGGEGAPTVSECRWQNQEGRLASGR